MAIGRRTIDRRRRVLYSAQQAEGETSTAASRREVERLREARRPTAAYGERVQRRINGRWFSLVPVHNRTFSIVASSIAGMTLLLCLLNYLAVTWPKLVYAPDISRVFRLDRTDSFGNWYQSILFAAAAGISLLTYQLRRYRLDDYLGRYRLWRTVLLATAICSVGTALSLTEWLGACLDLIFGKRVALSGADWVRLVVSVGAAVLALRLVAEIYRSRWSLVAMLAAVAVFAVPEAAGWNIIETNSPFRWSLVASAPLIGSTALVLSLGRYLRLLYREVCEIEDSPTLKERLSGLRFNVLRRDEDALEGDEVEPDDEPEALDESEPKSRWWRREKKADVVAEEPVEDSTPEAEQEDEPEPARKRRFGLGLRGRNKAASEESETEALNQAAAVEEESDTKESDEAPAKKRRFGLGGFLNRKSQSDDESSEDAPDFKPAKNESANDDSEGGDDIDWDSMSKAERRRLKKELKRKGRAA
ncbi:hypothetical protein Pla22_04980 [Rubripirellula amarantea]|uniref:Uncharacterized protein n=1 Tax=Rubripirellula amarantea TaxID=2527999 RepID=A0A5C5WQY3_9BACT|nr:hypothetical protein [Rubripirellula amarantea]TWT52870.1 hypothetical protein Pla22_04980 [Rubripirellula amarantea]